jgi:hypothetical protein
MIPWTNWKPFPDPRSGAPIEAPIGPGVLEVRCISTGETMVFRQADNVALAIMEIAAARSRPRLFGRRRPDATDLEYRTCAAANSMDAKSIVAHMTSQRRLFWRQAHAL